MRRVTEIHARKPRAIWKQNIIKSTYGDIVPTTQSYLHKSCFVILLNQEIIIPVKAQEN